MHPAPPASLDVTVVMPAFNRGALVTRALDSLLHQTRWPRELILVDDASTDDTVARVEQWAAHTGFPVRIERMERNGGAAMARNRGMAIATTPYIAFLDSDDEHLPETLAKLVAALDARPSAVVSFADATKVTSHKTIPNAMFLRKVNLEAISTYVGTDATPIRLLNDAKLLLLRSSLIPTCSTCFRREEALAAGGMPLNYRTGSDWMFWLRLTQRGEFVFYPEDLSIVHRHPDNLTNPQSAETTARLKLVGYASLLDGSAGITMTDAQRVHLQAQVREYIVEWRYQLSRLGFGAYWRGMGGARSLTGQSFLGHVLADPKSMLRAMAASVTTLPANVAE